DRLPYTDDLTAKFNELLSKRDSVCFEFFQREVTDFKSEIEIAARLRRFREKEQHNRKKNVGASNRGRRPTRAPGLLQREKYGDIDHDDAEQAKRDCRRLEAHPRRQLPQADIGNDCFRAPKNAKIAYGAVHVLPSSCKSPDADAEEERRARQDEGVFGDKPFDAIGIVRQNLMQFLELRFQLRQDRVFGEAV